MDGKNYLVFLLSKEFSRRREGWENISARIPPELQKTALKLYQASFAIAIGCCILPE